MKIKNMVIVLLVILVLISCAPAARVVQTETVIPTSTFAPAPTAILTFTPIPTSTSIPFPSNVILRVDGVVFNTTKFQDPDIALIQKAISSASYEVSKMGYDMGIITVDIATKKDTFLPIYMEAKKDDGFPLSETQARQDIEGGLTDFPANHYLLQFIGGDTWQRNDFDRYTQIIHGFFHTIQMTLSNKSGGGPENQPGPIWLIEGSASYFASSIACKYGLTASWYGWDWNSANQMFATTKLSDTVTIGYSNESPYVLGIAAIAQLVSKFGEDKIYEYFYLNNKENWKKAFEDTYGLTIDEFYLQFEKQRTSLNNIPQPTCLHK